jgi:hypothetical protein
MQGKDIAFRLGEGGALVKYRHIDERVALDLDFERVILSGALIMTSLVVRLEEDSTATPRLSAP